MDRGWIVSQAIADTSTIGCSASLVESFFGTRDVFVTIVVGLKGSRASCKMRVEKIATTRSSSCQLSS